MLDRARPQIMASFDRGHPGSLVILVVVLTLIGGTLVRSQGEEAIGHAAPAGPGAAGAAGPGGGFPAELWVEPGTTFSELLNLVDETGVDADEFARLAREPGWADLEGTPWETETLERMLLPGKYVIRSSSALPLVSEMLARFQLAVDDEVKEAAVERGLSLGDLIDRAAAIQATTSIAAEMPAVAELADLQAEPSTSVTPTVDALHASLWPTAFHDPASGSTHGEEMAPAGGQMEIVVLDGRGDPLTGATVTVGGESTTTGASGLVRVDPQGAGPIQVVASHPEVGSQSATWTGNHDQLVITLAHPVIRAMHVDGSIIGTERWLELLDLADRTAINGFVLDFKDESGRVFPQTDSVLAKRLGAATDSWNLASLTAELHRRGLWVVARIVAFQDPIVGEELPHLAARSIETGDPFTRGGLTYLDPTDPEARAYPIELAVEACEAGVDEIQFDYVRFPERFEGVARFDGPTDESSRVETISGFLAEARDAVGSACLIGADIFGFVTTVTHDGGIGQRLEDVAAAIPVVSPMLYPRLYTSGWLGFDDPNDHPGPIVLRSTADAVDRVSGGGTVIRPWIQDFGGYGPTEVRAQIDAVDSFGLGWMIWNAKSAFTVEAIPTEDEMSTPTRPAEPYERDRPRTDAPADLERMLALLPEAPEGRFAQAVGQTSGVEAEIGADLFFETGGLETMAIAFAARELIASGAVDSTSPAPARSDLLERELPDLRQALMKADIASALDLMIDDGSEAAALALIDAIGVDRLELTLRSAGLDSTSLRSRPMVTTARDVMRLAQLLDQGRGSGGPTFLDRFFERETVSWMGTTFVNRNGLESFGVERAGALHEVGRLGSVGGQRIVVHLSDAGEESSRAAGHLAHVTTLYARHYAPSFGNDETACTYEATDSGPLDGVTVGVDPGHGGKDSGAAHTFDDGTELLETDVNDAMATHVRNLLLAAGADVVMTRCRNETVSLGARAYTLNHSGVDIAISIHADASHDLDLNASSVVTYAAHSSGLASDIAGDARSALAGVVEGTNSITSVELVTSELALLMMTEPPIALLEPVTISFGPEAADLQAALAGRSDRLRTIARGIVEGIIDSAG